MNFAVPLPHRKIGVPAVLLLVCLLYFSIVCIFKKHFPYPFLEEYIHLKKISLLPKILYRFLFALFMTILFVS